MPSIPQILISSSDILFDKQDSKKDILSNLPTNKIITAKVIKLLSSFRAELQIGNQKVSAKTYVPLQEGDIIQVKASKTDNQYIFKIINDNLQNNINILKKLVSIKPYSSLIDILSNTQLSNKADNKAGSLENIVKIKELLNGIALKSETPDINFLKNLIKGSGLLWESKLSSVLESLNQNNFNFENMINNDFKALALKNLDLLNKDESLFTNIKIFADELEALQIINSNMGDDLGKYLLPIPFLSENQIKFGQIFLDLNQAQKKENKRKIVRIAFLLEMSNLGNIKADFTMLKDKINGNFFVANNEIADFIKQNIPILVNSLKNHNFKAHKIGCKVTPESILSATSLIDQIIDTALNKKNILSIIA